MSTSDTPDNADVPASASDAGPTDEFWVYGGVRLLRDKRAHLWITDRGHGERLLYAKTGSRVIGGLYQTAITRTDDKTSLHGTPRYLGTDEVDPELARQLRAEDHAARVRLAAARQERQAAKRDEINELLEPLRAVMRALPTRADRSAFLAHVLTELWRI